MLDLLRRNPLALALAVLMHVLIVLALVFGLDWLRPPKPRVGQTEPVQARLVDEDPVAKRKAEQARQAEAKRRAETAARAKAEQAAREKAAREAKVRAEREAREKAAREAKEQAAREAKLQAERAAKAKVAQEAKLEAAREAKLKAESEARAQAEREVQAKAARAAKEKAEREAREAAAAAAREAQARAARESKARAAREQAEREAEMAAQIEGERLAGERDKAVARIKAKVQQNWLRPPGTSQLKCVVRVRLGANGSVLLAQVVESSGNGAFDRSVEAAVRKADPLPMPESPSLVEEFRDIKFIFDPDNN